MNAPFKLSMRARIINGALFASGDAIGKREAAAEEALTEMQKHSGARRSLYELQAAAAASGLPEVECPLQHSFIDGVYVRTIFIPAGTVLVGKIHKHSHANILSKGEVVVVTEDGGREHLVGPITMTSPAGCKRAVHAITDTTWTTIHRTDETDLAKIEDWVIAKTYEDYERFKLELTTPDQPASAGFSLPEGEAMKQIEVSP